MGETGVVLDWGRKVNMAVDLATVPRLTLFPEGCLTLVAGEPGSGKSLLTLELAARMSVRSAWFPEPVMPNPMSNEDIPGALGYFQRPRMSLVCCREDGTDTLKYRLMAAGADARFVEEGAGLSLLPRKGERWDRRDLDYFGEWREREERSTLVRRVAHLADKHLVGLVVLDPLPAFLEEKDVSHSATVRKVMEPLLKLARHYGFAVVGVMHLNKRRGGMRGMERALGSTAYTALARSVMVVMQDEEERDRRIVVPWKNTSGPISCGYSFWIRGWEMKTEEVVARSGRVEWESAGVRLGVMEEGEEERLSAREAARGFLREMLKDGPCASRRLNREARELGIGMRTLAQVKREEGVRSWREGERWMMGAGK